MKIKDCFVIREIMGQAVVVPLGETGNGFSGLIKLNETGKDIWEALMEDKTEEEIIKKIICDYNVSEEKAKKDVMKFLKKMREKGFLEE